MASNSLKKASTTSRNILFYKNWTPYSITSARTVQYNSSRNNSLNLTKTAHYTKNSWISIFSYSIIRKSENSFAKRTSWFFAIPKKAGACWTTTREPKIASLSSWPSTWCIQKSRPKSRKFGIYGTK